MKNSPNPTLRNKLRWMVSILILGISMSACGFLGFGGTVNWKEEVQLNDGRMIVVERETLTEGGGDEWAHNRSLSKPKERHIRFAHPDGSGQTIEWRSTKNSPRTWPETPLILDVETGRPVVFALVAISDGCEIYSKYIYRNDIWTEEKLPEKFEKRATNLLIRDGIERQKFVNLEEKSNKNAEVGYRPSLREVGPTRQVCGG